MSFRDLLASLLLAVLLLGLAVDGLAQSVRWSPNGGSLALRRANELQLVFENCSPEELPRVPTVEGLPLTEAGRSESTQIMNGKITRSVILGFAARPTEEKTFVIPEFTVKTDQGTLRVPATTFSVASPAAARTDGSVALEDVAHAKFVLPAEVYAGEVFPLRYEQTTVRRYFSQYGSDLRWDPSPLSVEDWQAPTTAETLQRGERNLVLSLETRALAPQAGDLTLKQGNQLINLITGNGGGFFFSSNVDQFSIPTSPAVLRVKPLPAGAPASFAGAVGQFTLTSKAVPAQARVGEPITWTLTLAGSGNWTALQGLPAREVSTQLRAVQAQPKRTLANGKLFDGTLDEDVVLIPEEPGTYTFGPYTYTYFDPAKGSYMTLNTPTHTIKVLPAAPTNANLATTGGAGAGGMGDVRPAGPAPGLPAPVPGEVIAATAGAGAPLTTVRWLLACALPGAWLLLGWCALAVRRALELDPHTPLRRARAAAHVILRELATTTDPAARRRLLARWQTAVANEQGVTRASPAAEALADDPEGQRLWREAEAHLYAAQRDLPADWPTRAEAHLAARPPKPFRLGLLWRWSIWLPLFALLALVPVSTEAAPDAARTAYEKGDYLAAEALWRTALEKDPSSASLHLNLSLALAQQGTWGEATAHATLALAQDPNSDATQRQLRYLLKKPGFTPQVLPDLLGDGPRAALLRQTTPRGWQGVVVGLAVLAALAAGLALLRRHRRIGRPAAAAAWTLLALSAAVLPAALYSYFGYGITRHPDAVLVWRETALYSVPTAADSDQQKSNVAPGTLARAERHFLTWTQLTFADGQKGWVQTADVMSFWPSPGPRR